MLLLTFSPLRFPVGYFAAHFCNLGGDSWECSHALGGLSAGLEPVESNIWYRDIGGIWEGGRAGE